METLADGYRALVVGESGGIGSAVLAELASDPRCGNAVGLSRKTSAGFDLTVPGSIEWAADDLKGEGPFDLIFDATGALIIEGVPPEKTIKALDAEAMARQFAVNAIGPALLFKHFLPLLNRNQRSLFATLSARVGSIGDNHLGGWISYRASKAALNQIVRTVSREAARTHRQSVIAAFHPGTVETRLSDAYCSGKERQKPAQSAAAMLAVLDRLTTEQSGGFFAYDGTAIEW